MVKQEYTYAVDSDSSLINVRESNKSNEYYCPCCGGIMIPKQGNIRRWHFAHKGNGNCSYETYLHRIAKMRILECFKRSSKFIVPLKLRGICNADCPLGCKQPCVFEITKNIDLKRYYDNCKEEVQVGDYRGDLVFTYSIKNNPPILLEIFVSHRSTQEKLHSGYRIIELSIESEADIDRIIAIAEGDVDGNKIPDDKIQCYNFSSIKEEPPIEQRPFKFQFWIDSKENFHFSTKDIGDLDDSDNCLSTNSADVENSIFRIDANRPILREFAFHKLSESGLDIRYCISCDYYRYNDKYGKSICILYRSKGTPQFPRLLNAVSCSNFKLKRDSEFYNEDYRDIAYRITSKK